MPVDTERLREEIQKVYGEVARDPKRGHHFHTGPDYAVERLRYSPDELSELAERLPETLENTEANHARRSAGGPASHGKVGEPRQLSRQSRG
jgi:hypothetical protein